MAQDIVSMTSCYSIVCQTLQAFVEASLKETNLTYAYDENKECENNINAKSTKKVQFGADSAPYRRMQLTSAFTVISDKARRLTFSGSLANLEHTHYSACRKVF